MVAKASGAIGLYDSISSCNCLYSDLSLLIIHFEELGWLSLYLVGIGYVISKLTFLSDLENPTLSIIGPNGLHYKVPSNAQGVLVYEIDTTKSEHGMGMKLSLPSSRPVTNESKPFFLAAASLKKGESTTSNGYVFTVLDAGTFGEVIKISKD